MIIKYFDDTLYPKSQINNLRHTVRVFLKNENHKYMFLHIVGVDDFGKRDHYESIGGGIEKGESKVMALQREVLEECGLVVNNIQEIGTIIDRYYLINRETHSHFFYGEVNTTKQMPRHLTDMEKNLFDGFIYLDEDEVLNALNYDHQNNVGILVMRRDYCAFDYFLKNK